MKLSEKIQESGLTEEINRICSTSNAIYSIKAKVSRLNNALDRYFHLAFKADRRGSFDDINQSASPIETQTLVTATNKYKFSAFTNEIQNVLRMAVLNGAGLEVPLTHEVMDDITNFGEQYKTSVTGTPQFWTRFGDFVYLRPCPLTGNFTAALGLKAYVERTSTKFEFLPVITISNGASALVTAAAVHGLSAGDTVVFETDGALPTGLTADTVQYFVIAAGLTTTAFEVSTTLGGSAVTTSSGGSGNHTYIKTSKVPGIPSIHHEYLARHASLPFLIEKKSEIKNDIAQLIIQDEGSITQYFANREKDLENVLEAEVIESI